MSTLSLTSAFGLLLKRDLTLAYRRRSEMINPLLFFVLVSAMFPLGIGNDPGNLIQAVGPGVVWVAALLAALLSLDSMFRSDFEDGSLEQFMLSAHPVSILVLAKILAHWLITGLPLFIVAPLLAIMLNIPTEAIRHADADPSAGHPGAEPDRLFRGGADRGTTTRRGDPVAVGAAPLCASA